MPHTDHEINVAESRHRIAMSASNIRRHENLIDRANLIMARRSSTPAEVARAAATKATASQATESDEDRIELEQCVAWPTSPRTSSRRL